MTPIRRQMERACRWLWRGWDALTWWCLMGALAVLRWIGLALLAVLILLRIVREDDPIFQPDTPHDDT